MNDMPSHPRLLKRGAVFYHRAAIPADIRSSYPKTEETFSLKTRDPREAHRLVRIEAARVDALFQAHREEQARLSEPPMPELTDAQIKALGDAFYVRLLSEDEEERLRGFEEADFADYEQDTAAVEEIARRLYARGERPNFLTDVFAETARGLGVHWRLAESSPSWAKVNRAFLAATIKATEAKRQRNAGDVVETPALPSVSEPIPSKGITLTALFDLWKRDHLAEDKSERTVADFQQKIDSFIAFLGHEDATRVSQRDVAAFCDLLRHERGLAARTVNGKYLTGIRTVYRLGKEKAVIAIDPTEDVRVRVSKAVSERPKGFTDEEAQAILSCALRDPETLGGMSDLNKLACRWVPWLCAYTGARAGEITQLRREDFTEERGIPCLTITPEAGSVKNRKYRKVPLHSHLIEQGILEFVKSRPTGPLFFVPNDLKRTRGHKQSDSVTGKVSEWVREKAKVTDTRIQPNHAWRHRFKTVAREVDIPQRYMDAIQGHEDGSASSDYGENTMKALYREIAKMPRYEDT